MAVTYAASVDAVINPGGSDPTDIWQWFMANVTIQGTVNILGLSLLVILFSRDLILTKGQHERRVADISKNYFDRANEREAAHDEAMLAKDERYADLLTRYAEMKESRDYYRQSRIQEQDGKDKVVSALIESNKGLHVAARALAAFDQAALPRSGDT